MGIGTLIKQRAVFFDRDGVLNQAIIRNAKPYPPAHLAEVIIPEDANAALNALKSAGFLLIGATNQPDVARGTASKQTVETINHYLLTQLPLNEIRVCFHDSKDQCLCRKPLPGLLTQAAVAHHIDLARSVMIGDRWKDIDAGKGAGCKTIWLKQSYDEQTPEAPDFIAHSLTESAKWILTQMKYWEV